MKDQNVTEKNSADHPEIFKRATAAAYRALSGINVHEVHFSKAPPLNSSDLYKDVAPPVLPTPKSKPDPATMRKIRGAADRKAVQLRFHNPKSHAVYKPEGEKSAAVFDILELARCEALGIENYQGVARNIKKSIDSDLRKYASISKDDDAPEHFMDALHLAGLVRLCGYEPARGGKQLLRQWEEWFGSRDIYSCLEELKTCRHDQEKFAKSARDMLQRLDLDLVTSEKQEQETQNDGPDDDQNNPDGSTDEKGDDSQDQNEEQDKQSQIALPENFAENADSQQDEAQQNTAEQDEKPPSQYKDDQRSPDINAPLRKYEIYTTKFDEVIKARDLADENELHRLRRILDQQLTHLQGIITRLANRLQRKLMARQQRSWKFDQEEGLLDTSRLARIVANPTTPLSFKQEQEDDFKDTLVTLLIDNSGSMRGRPISIAAMSTDIIARTLERTGVKTEILGFTTRAWKGGRSRDLWAQNGRSPHPGRLNDLRHIIYKSADMPWRRSRKNLGLMLKEGLLKENIDGEALLWAHSRLISRPEERKILIVISDGAPVDDSTLSVNPSNVLEEDLHNVIQWIQERSPVELSAIGIGHDVTRYYKKAITIADADQLGQALTDQLEDLFDSARI